MIINFFIVLSGFLRVGWNLKLFVCFCFFGGVEGAVWNLELKVAVGLICSLDVVWFCETGVPFSVFVFVFEAKVECGLQAHAAAIQVGLSDGEICLSSIQSKSMHFKGRRRFGSEIWLIFGLTE